MKTSPSSGVFVNKAAGSEDHCAVCGKAFRTGDINLVLEVPGHTGALFTHAIPSLPPGARVVALALYYERTDLDASQWSPELRTRVSTQQRALGLLREEIVKHGRGPRGQA